MRILPAIDLHDQMCVRLVKGDYATAHKVAEDAVDTAKAFLDAGAEQIHMVDLDGAKDGTHPNYPVVRRVIEQTGAAVELGGGIRTMEDVERVLELGVKRVIIGSAAVKNPQFVKEACEKYGDKIAVGIDALHGTVRTEGWIKDSGTDYIAFAKLMESYGVKTIIFTDIDKDGMLSGPNLSSCKHCAMRFPAALWHPAAFLRWRTSPSCATWHRRSLPARRCTPVSWMSSRRLPWQQGRRDNARKTYYSVSRCQ